MLYMAVSSMFAGLDGRDINDALLEIDFFVTLMTFPSLSATTPFLH